jgi:hypothetical protein
MSDLLEKLAEYISLQVPHVWVIDPRRRKGFMMAFAWRS